MRIIGGTLGGRLLKAPPGSSTRPTSDRVREAIFNILGTPPPGTRVLDLFAGAGCLGLEALSRGAVHAVFVDQSRAAVRCVRENARSLGVDARCRVLSSNVPALLRRWCSPSTSVDPADAQARPPFGLVFVDPPYRGDLAVQTLDLLGGSALVGPDTIVVVEHDRRNPPPNNCGSLVRKDSRRYGDTEVSFYRTSSMHTSMPGAAPPEP